MTSHSQQPRNRALAAASVLATALFTLVVLAPRVRTMNRAIAQDGDPATVLASVFVVSMVIPLLGLRRRPHLTRWPMLLATQAGCAAVAVATLTAVTPSGDGLYALAISLFALLALAGSMAMTIWARRDSQAGFELGPRRTDPRHEASGLPSYPSEYRHHGDDD